MKYIHNAYLPWMAICMKDDHIMNLYHQQNMRGQWYDWLCKNGHYNGIMRIGFMIHTKEELTQEELDCLIQYRDEYRSR